MRRFGGWLGLFVILLLGLGFAASNAGRQVTIDLGLLTLYQVPITFVAFGGMVVGMGVVLIAGISADLKVRRILQDRNMGEVEVLGERTPENSRSRSLPESEPFGQSRAEPIRPPPPEQLPLEGDLPLE